jgi:hydroxylamine dehydrogenase
MVCLICAPILVAEDEEVSISEQTEECLDCHRAVTPGIVADWELSHHAHETPAEALQVPELEREVSSASVPEALQNIVVGCYECHSLNTEKHQDSFKHFDHTINVVVSPEDCATCHSEERDQFVSSKKGYAHANLAENPIYHLLVETATSVTSFEDGELVRGESSDTAKWETCYGCHGTRVEVTGTRTIDHDLGEVEVPVLSNWPNQGVGRLNPDGSRGACTACHPRHGFSVEIARKPETCSQCHLEPDLPAWNVYRESKHGNIYDSKQDDWNWENVPWTVGRDFTAPTCSVCHNSLLVDLDGEVIAERSHDFGARLWVRIFGLIYSHPQPNRGDTFSIRNADGQPLPLTFDGRPAAEFLLNGEQQAARRAKMQRVCTACHSTRWAQEHFAKLDRTNGETDTMVKTAMQLMLKAWEIGMAESYNPFDEYLEQKWLLQWLFYANSVRYASAMAGPDYAAFKNGWWYLNKNLREIRYHLDLGIKK